MPLKGIAIGNGWIDSKTQYPAYLEYGLKHGLLSEGDDVSRALGNVCPCSLSSDRTTSEPRASQMNVCKGYQAILTYFLCMMITVNLSWKLSWQGKLARK
jgi:hypothetical protein